MSDLSPTGPPDDLPSAARRFDAALARLERVLASAVSDIADLARRTGYADGHAAGLAEGLADGQSQGDGAVGATGATGAAGLRDPGLEARNAELEQAVAQARTALDAAIDDIRSTLGQV